MIKRGIDEDNTPSTYIRKFLILNFSILWKITMHALDKKCTKFYTLKISFVKFATFLSIICKRCLHLYLAKTFKSPG